MIRFDSLIDDDLGNEFYEHDDPDDDPDYSDDNDFGYDDNIGDNDDDIPIDPALLGELDNLETFEPAEEDSESENETQLAADSALQTFHHDLKAAGGFKKARNGRLPQAGGNRGGGRRAVGESTVSFEVSSMLGDANMCFVSGDLDGALAVVKKIIRIEAGVFAAWKLMGEIHREKGETKNCLLAFLTAAHTKPKEAELWVECAKMTMQLGEEEAAMGAGESSIKVFGKGGYKEQAIYCYSRAIASNPDDFDAIHERARLYWQIEQFKKAAEGLLMLYKVMPEDLSILKELARLYTDMGEEKIEEAADLYRKAIDKFVKKGNKNCVVGWSEINIFAELHIMANQYKEAIYVVRHYGRWLLGRAEEDFWDALDDDREWNTSDPKRDEVPEYDPDRFAPETYGLVHELRVKLGVCRLRLGQPELAKVKLLFYGGFIFAN